MKILIFDSTWKRAEQNAAVLSKMADVLVRFGETIRSHPGDETLHVPIICDLVLLHDNNRDVEPFQLHQQSGTIKTSGVLRYSGSGCPDGIVRGVSSDAPLTAAEGREIVAVCQRPSEEWAAAFRRIWSGVPELLLAWVLCKYFTPEKSGTEFKNAEIAIAFNQLRASVLLRPDIKDVPSVCGEGVLPPLENAKRLIELARVDI